MLTKMDLEILDLEPVTTTMLSEATSCSCNGFYELVSNFEQELFNAEGRRQ
jgi:hypothetical protein